MCGAGGGDKAAEDAKRAEAERQATISGNVAGINSAYAGREPQYAELGEALRTRLNEGVNLQRQNATRQNKFSLARSGLTGGSAAIDAGRTLNRESREATLAAEREAQKGVAGLRAQDEDARSRMISLAQSGSDIGNAAAQTASALRANIQGAQSASNVSNLGDLFGGTAETYRRQQDAAARRRGLQDAQIYAKPGER